MGLWGACGHPCSCLLQISVRQGLQADPGALAALCEKTDNDIRACINTLQVSWGPPAVVGWGGAGGRCLSPPTPSVQFLHGRGQRELSVRAVQATRVGLKDQRKGLFSVWQEVFQLPRAQR